MILTKVPSVVKCKPKSIFQLRLKHEWKQPNGYDTGIKIYNIYRKEKVPLIFPNKNLVKWYICGPTVYDYSHIGHGSSYIRFDIIRRVLEEYFDIKPLVALGITDIADKISKRAKAKNITCKELTKTYETEFHKQMNMLNIIQPTFVMKVSEHLPQIIAYVTELLNKGVAYKSEDGSVYYDTQKDVNYGRLSLIPSTQPEKLIEGKKHFTDFALWKSEKNGEESYESPWGKGIPGWHIECSVLANEVFGSTVDMHSGGSDLIYPHHENEEAQSCSFHNCHQWVNYWVHSGLLITKHEKMSKSLHNFISLSDFLETYKSDHLRLLCIMTQYRTDISFSGDQLNLVVDTYKLIKQYFDVSEAYIKGSWFDGNVQESKLMEELEKTRQSIHKHLADDFDLPGCFSSVMELLRLATKMIHEKPDELKTAHSPAVIAAVSNFLKHFFQSVGFDLGKVADKTDSTFKLEDIINIAVNLRTEVRKKALASQDKQMKLDLLGICDQARNNFNMFGIQVHDTGTQQASWEFQESTKRIETESIEKKKEKKANQKLKAKQ